jgi:drug/metabolite transporter (DMT)-like permease
VVNTAVGFTLWNDAQRTLTAMELNSIADTLVFQVALLEWAIFGLGLSARELGGMVLAFMGGALVQLRHLRRKRVPTEPLSSTSEL